MQVKQHSEWVSLSSGASSAMELLVAMSCTTDAWKDALPRTYHCPLA